MASKQAYAPISTTVDQEVSQQSLCDDPRPRERISSVSLVAFTCGLLLDVAITCAFNPAVAAVSKAITGMPVNSTTATERIDFSDLNNIGFILELTDLDLVWCYSRHEALAAGCHYDLMALRWYTHECYNGEVLNDFLGEIDLNWHHGGTYSQPTTMDLVHLGEFDRLYPLQNYHIFHCLYQWRRLHLAFIEHRHLDEDVFSYVHTLYCTHMLSKID